MGGNGPLVICEDGDLDKAVEATLVASFLNAGQSCTAGERFLVHEDVKDEYLSKLSDAIGQRIELGDPFDDATTMGPVNNEPTAAKTERHVTEALERGARHVDRRQAGSAARERALLRADRARRRDRRHGDRARGDVRAGGAGVLDPERGGSIELVNRVAVRAPLRDLHPGTSAEACDSPKRSGPAG